MPVAPESSTAAGPRCDPRCPAAFDTSCWGTDDRSLGRRARAGGLGGCVRVGQPRRIALLQRQPGCLPSTGAALSAGHARAARRPGAPRRAGGRPLPTFPTLRRVDLLPAARAELPCPGELPARSRLLSAGTRPAGLEQGIGRREADVGAVVGRRPGRVGRDERSSRTSREHHGRGRRRRRSGSPAARRIGLDPPWRRGAVRTRVGRRPASSAHLDTSPSPPTTSSTPRPTFPWSSSDRSA